MTRESTKYKKIIREFENYKKITKPKKNPNKEAIWLYAELFVGKC